MAESPGHESGSSRGAPTGKGRQPSGEGHAHDDRCSGDEGPGPAGETGAAPGGAPDRGRAHVVVRLARMSLAVVLLAAGAAMLVLPGPGWLVIAAGLAVLARDVAWAERWLVAVRRRIPGARPDGSVPRGVVATVVVVALAAAAFSLWLALG